MAATLQLKNVLIETPDLDGAISDFASMSAGVAFRDADRYAVLAPDDHPAPGELVLTAKTERVGEAVADLVGAGAEVVTPTHQGGHEVRALVRTAGGILLLVYGPQE
jgi:hypothetical protein